MGHGVPHAASSRFGALAPYRDGERLAPSPPAKTWSQSLIVSGRADRKVFEAKGAEDKIEASSARRGI